MRVEPLSRQHAIKALVSRHAEELAAAGYPAGAARQAVAQAHAGAATGLVAWADGKVVGLLIWKGRSGRVLVSLLAVGQADPQPAVRALLARALPAWRAAGADVIIYQARQADPAPYQRAFTAAGFDELLVEKMILKPPSVAGAPALPAGYRLVPWQPQYVEPAAQLFPQLPRHSLEALVWPRLATPAGARELVEMLSEGDARACFVVLDEATPGAPLAGYVLAQRLRAGAGRIGELGVAPAHARRGLGRALMQAAIAALADAPDIWLTVASSNTAARALYLGLGFALVETQSVFVCAESKH